MAALGMDGMAWLEEKDPFKRSLIDSVFVEAIKTRNIMDDNLAARITARIGKLLGG